MNADLKPGTRVQAILLDENHTPLPDMIGTVVPVSEWPASFPEQWTDENTVIVRWDSEEGRKPFTPYRRDVAERVLRETGGLSPLQTFSSTDPAPQDHGPLAAPLSDRTLAKVLSRPAHVPLSEMKSTRVFGFNVVTISPQGIPGGPRLDGVVSRQRAQDELDELEPFMVDGWKTVMVELREVVS